MMHKRLVLTLVLVLGMAATASAQHVNWTGAASNLWSDPCNWDLDPGPPTSSDNAWIDPSAGPNWPVIDYYGAEAMIVWLGDWTEGTAYLTITDGTLDVDEGGPGYGVGESGYIYVGGGYNQDNQYIVGEFHVDGGTVRAGGLSIYSGGSVVDVNGAGKIILTGDVVSEMQSYISAGDITGTGVAAYLDDSGNTVVQIIASGYAYNPKPSDGAIRVDPHRVLSWGLPPDVCNPTYDVYLGTDPNFSGESPVAADLTEPNYNPEPDLDYMTKYYWRVDVNDPNGGGTPVINQGAVWSFTTGGVAYNPTPAHGAGPLNYVGLELSWTKGIDANEHDVYFGTNQAAVATADTTDTTGIYLGRQAVDNNSYTLPDLAADVDYYWRVDEVNDSGAPQWPGGVWWFWTNTHLVVDDLDYLSNTNLYAVWNDYWVNGSGAEIFVETAPAFVHSGIASMAFHYDNTFKAAGKYVGSRTDALISDLEIGPDWTDGQSKALVLWFRGEPGNTVTANDQLYVALDDGSTTGLVTYAGDLNDLADNIWHEWNIDLQDFNNLGVTLSSVDTIVLGLGGYAWTGQSAAGGTGWAYFDEIGLWQSRCVLDYAPAGDVTGDCRVNEHDLDVMSDDWLQYDYNLTAVPVDANHLPARYQFDDFNNSGAAGSDADGTPYGDANIVVDGTRGNVLLLGGNDGDYIDCNGVRSDINDPPTWADITGSITVAMWAKTDGSIPEGWHGFVNKRFDSSSSELTWSVEGIGNEVRWAFVPDWGTGWGDSGDNEIYVDITFHDGQWHHIAAVYDINSYSAVYIDGVEVGHLDLAADYGHIIASTGPVLIGGYGGIFAGENFPGSLDEVRIYDEALSQAEIIDAMQLSALYIPVHSPANLYDAEPILSKKVNFMDYDIMADDWLVEQLWP